MQAKILQKLVQIQKEKEKLLRGDLIDKGKSLSNRVNKNDKNKKYTQADYENDNLLPELADRLSVSVMNENGLAIEVFQYMADEGLITSPNYDSVIQSAVKFYRPDLALQYYDEMRVAELHPSTQTISDLIYSITHNMAPEQFSETGALQIARILGDLSGNPSAQVNDAMFLHLYYGVHMYDFTTQQSVQAVNKYNYHILREMEACVKSGVCKIKFSTAYKMLEMNNLTVADRPKSCFAQDLVVAVHDLYHQHPDYFIRDLETDDSIKFLPLLLDMSRRHHHDFSMDTFYLRHVDDIRAIIDSWHSSSHNLGTHVLRLIMHLQYDLCTDDGADNETRIRLTKATYRTLEEAKKASVWDLYRDCFKPNLGVASLNTVMRIVRDMFLMLHCLDPFTAEVDYVIGKYRNVVDEFVCTNQLCVKSVLHSGGKDRFEVVEFYVMLEMFFNRFLMDYLEHFSIIENNTDEKLTMSQDNMLDVVHIATSCISLLLEQEGVPTTAMVDTLLTYILKSGEHLTAWRMLDMYHNYKIELETATLLTFVQLSPDWETRSMEYLDSVSEPMRTLVKDRIESLEKQEKKRIDAISRDDSRPKVPKIPGHRVSNDNTYLRAPVHPKTNIKLADIVTGRRPSGN